MLYSSGPQAFWRPGSSFVEDNFSIDWGKGEHGSGSNVSNGE